MADAGVFPKISNDIIYVLDYNTIQAIVFDVKTNFYGAACVSSQLSTVFITNDNWNNLKTDIDYCIAIQGTPLTVPLTTKLDDGTIFASDINLYKVAADQINANKRGFYSVNASASTVDEGSAITFTVSTLYVPAGTVLSWSTTGSAGTADFTDGTVSGTVTISGTILGGSGTITRTLTSDSSTEGSEAFTMSIFNGAELVATSTSVGVNDTSQDPPPPPSDSGCFSCTGDGGGDSGCAACGAGCGCCADAACAGDGACGAGSDGGSDGACAA
jgi:hypothetical protein